MPARTDITYITIAINLLIRKQSCWAMDLVSYAS